MDSFSDSARAAERRRVLEMLERGQISAAEADELMAALEGRSVNQELEPGVSLRFSGEEVASIPGLLAAMTSVARALARTIAHLSIALGRAAGAVARMSERARRLWPAGRRRRRWPGTGL